MPREGCIRTTGSQARVQYLRESLISSMLASILVEDTNSRAWALSCWSSFCSCVSLLGAAYTAPVSLASAFSSFKSQHQCCAQGLSRGISAFV